MFSREPASVRDTSPVSLAFSKQAAHFDADDRANPVLQEWRKQIYAHVQKFLRPGTRMLELNAGTGIDALYFAGQGIRVHATDLSEGMIAEMHKKIIDRGFIGITCQQVSFDHLDKIPQQEFDYLFSNFGGLNCIKDLTLVTRHLSKKLNPGAFVTWVVMPPLCPWEWAWLLKGKWSKAFRRFHKEGTLAHLEGEYFQTYYHSLGDVRRALGKSFELVCSEGLGVVAAPPSATNFYRNHPILYRVLKRMDSILKDHFPFNRWGDHIIVTFKFSGQ